MAFETLPQIQAGLNELRSDGIGVQQFSAQARGAVAVLRRLPPRYGEVWLQLLDRLESSALFSEESCSFSQKDLLDNLQVWIDKAQGQLS